ncbi:hypothetical protein HYW32_01265 [Candidatus Berkelbacteria bacterium]|nr:hypothetical protein [Candidatus Berkelbacteria bacterium]
MKHEQGLPAGEAGSALLITMIVITVIGSVSFAVANTTLSEFRSQARLEDGLNAFAASSAGIEDGLARWRFNRNSEVPADDNGSCTAAPRPTTSTTYYDRVNLTDGTVETCIDPENVDPPDPADIVYDIKMYYKRDPGEDERVVGQNSPQGYIPALKQDTSVEYDVTELEQQNGQVLLNWDFLQQVFCGSSQYFEVTALDSQGQITHKENFDPCPFGSSSQYGGFWNFPLNGGNKLRFRPYGDDLDSYTLRPINGSQAALDGRFTTIETVGYYGTSKRKLKLVLDRLSGTILPIYDYVLFSENSGINP